MGPANGRGYFHRRNISGVGNGNTESARKRKLSQIGFIVAMLVLSVAARLPAQNSPKVNMVDPLTGKVNDSVTLTGQNLGKESVSGVFLSDDKDDFKATLVDQDNAKIVLKVPQVKSGGYNISIQEGDKILILPLRFTVQG
jgi:hypothetical protein